MTACMHCETCGKAHAEDVERLVSALLDVCEKAQRMAWAHGADELDPARTESGST